MSEHRFSFKMVYSCKNITYDINLDTTIADFINIVKSRIRNDFNISDDFDIQIVEAGQFNNVNGRDPELAPALEISDKTIREKYENVYKQTAFYIRLVNPEC
jgi:hypothetical protein